MTKLPDPRIEICALAHLIEVRAHALANLAHRLAEITDPNLLEAEHWNVHSASLEALLDELSGDVKTVISKAQYAT